MSDFFIYLLRSGAYLALFYTFYRVALSRDTFFALNRAFLLGSAALSLVLPLFRVPSPFFKTVIYSSGSGLAADASPILVPSREAGPLSILIAVYAAGAGLFLLLFIVRVARLALMARRCGCQRHDGLRVVICGHSGESFSFFNFVFLNKTIIADGDLDRVLAHELAHVRQRHSFDIVFAEFLTVIQWFNPFVWPYKRSLRETHEYLADRAVVAQGCGLARYQLLIVEQHVGGRLLELASSFRTSQIKRRIVMLSRQETKGLARWKPLLILPLAVILVLAFAESRTVVQAGPAVTQAPARAAQETADKGAKAATLSEEEMAKALKQKAAQLEEMKKLNTEKMAKLKAKLEAATDPDAKAKIKAAMQQEKILSLEIGAKERTLKMKSVEMALAKQSDPAKKAEMEKKLQALKTEADQYLQKLEQVRKAEEKAKQAEEKK
jgi:hypothetical protein